MAYEPFSTMLSKYGNSVSVCSKLKQAENRLYLQIKFGRILEILWAFLIKQLLHALALPGRDMR